jgi:hypothetical protein
MPSIFRRSGHAAIIALATAASACEAAVIPHDQVAPIAQNGTAVELKFRPRLKVEDGCVPFPAVDAQGNTSGGLCAAKPSPDDSRSDHSGAPGPRCRR